MKLYGCPGCGSAAIEAMLQMAGLAYEYVKATPREPDEKRDELKRINPLAQVPTLLLDDGAEQENAFKEKITERIKAVWGVLENALQPAPMCSAAA